MGDDMGTKGYHMIYETCGMLQTGNFDGDRADESGYFLRKFLDKPIYVPSRAIVKTCLILP